MNAALPQPLIGLQGLDAKSRQQGDGLYEHC